MFIEDARGCGDVVFDVMNGGIAVIHAGVAGNYTVNLYSL